ncbi:MAG: DNA repair protein RadC [Lachnospiraceae bacterium]|nr:DNA repair protein RadC [Lachnospiraceae bacterium]
MKNTVTIKQLPDSMKPYEKCEQYGVSALSDVELLSAIIRSGTINVKSTDVIADILQSNEGAGLMNLHTMSLKELQEFNGIGRVKAIQLKCVAELTKRMARQTKNVGECFDHPLIVAEYYMEHMRNLDRENLVVVMLDSKSRRKSDVTVSVGSVNSSVASTREIFCQALKCGAVRIILLHNHPSGDSSPSKEDLYVTQKVKEAGELICIPMVDHIIIGDNNYYSMKEAGYL